MHKGKKAIPFPFQNGFGGSLALPSPMVTQLVSGREWRSESFPLIPKPLSFLLGSGKTLFAMPLLYQLKKEKNQKQCGTSETNKY